MLSAILAVTFGTLVAVAINDFTHWGGPDFDGDENPKAKKADKAHNQETEKELVGQR